MGSSGSYSKSCLTSRINNFRGSTLTRNDINNITNQCKTSSRATGREQFNGSNQNYYNDNYNYDNNGPGKGAIVSSSVILIIILVIILVAINSNKKQAVVL